MARVLYICHDNPRPSGGIRVLYRHVEALRNGGIDAYVVHFSPEFRPAWFDSEAPVVYASAGLALSPADWVVIPEDHRQALAGLRGVACRKAILCQGHYLVFDGIEPGECWKDYGVSEVLVTSRPIADFVRQTFAVSPTFVPLSIDHAIFRPPAEPSARKLQVAYMPRKGPRHIRMAQGILRQRAPQLASIPWVAIDNLHESQVAALFRESAFFLATGYQEGFGLPPVEAMACGALVIGYQAGGGADYATDQNGLWVADEDTLGLADTLIEALGSYAHDPRAPRWEVMRRAGLATASRYIASAEREALLRFWTSPSTQAGR